MTQMRRYGNAPESAIADIRAAWQSEDFNGAFVAGLKRLIPGTEVAIHDWLDGRPRGLAYTLPAPIEASPWVAEGLASRLRTYEPQRPHRTDMMAVVGIQIARSHPDAWKSFSRHFLRFYGLRDQLRILLYDGKHRTYYCGLFARRDRADFAAEDAETLERLRTVLADHLVLRRVFDETPHAVDTVVRVLDAFDEPAFVVSESGAVIHANAAARRRYVAMPEELRVVARSPDSTHAFARHVRLELGARPIHLVVERTAAHPGALDIDLPPRLARIARALLEGGSEREVAARTGLTHATVRTYVRQLYRKLGVRSRVELARRLMRH
jgi:DNA-binding NarL/FixJ family response regulator